MIKDPNPLAPAQIEWLLKNGKRYRNALCPDDMPRGKVGDCFDHCLVIATRMGRWRYVEGIVENPRVVIFKEDGDRWIHHAWLTDGIHSFDPTWTAVVEGKETTFPVLYIGIEMETEAIARFVLETEYKAVLKNGWRNPHYARACVGNLPLTP